MQMKLSIVALYMMRGILGMLSGFILILLSPAIWQILLIFAIYFFLEGLAELLVGAEQTDKDRTRWYVLGGAIVNFATTAFLLGTGGMITLLFPRIGNILLLYFVIFRILLIGIIELLGGIIRKYAGAVSTRIAIGVVSVAVAIAVFFLREKGILALALPLGAYFAVQGILLMIVVFQVRFKKKSALAHR
jgi:uncharacterized membrane protein HdeD (DUF308 family)